MFLILLVLAVHLNIAASLTVIYLDCCISVSAAHQVFFFSLSHFHIDHHLTGEAPRNVQ